MQEDIERLIYNPNAKEWKVLREQKNAFEKLASMDLFEKQLDQEIAELRSEENYLIKELKEKEIMYT